MKTKQLLAGLFVAGTIFTANAQDVSSTPYLTSGGSHAGQDGEESTYYGFQAGEHSLSQAMHNCFFGHRAGIGNQTGARNVFAGYKAGEVNDIGDENVFIGYITGYSNSLGKQNVFLGSQAGRGSKAGSNNVMVGHTAGDRNISGDHNTYIGSGSGGNGDGYNNNNTFIGYNSGYTTKGSGNVYIGNQVGTGITASDMLMIHNNDNPLPLIWGNFKIRTLKLNGKVGIGGISNFPSTSGEVDVTNYKLFVKGGILTEEVRIQLMQEWADYVFKKDYVLPTLDEVETFIQENGHLPNVPSAEEIKRDGLELGQISTIQQEKIEELTLYLIEQKKQIEKQENEIKELKALVQQLIDRE